MPGELIEEEVETGRETREERARRILPHLRRWVEVLGLHAVAARAGLHPAGLRKYLKGNTTPITSALDAYEEMLRSEDGDPKSAFRDWTPTEESVGALPPPLRRYIRELQERGMRRRRRARGRC